MKSTSKLPNLPPLASFALWIALLWLSAIGVLWFAWTGFIASDDEYYVSGALGWLGDWPYVPQNFGTIRSVVTIPLACILAILGESETTAIMSTAGYLLLTLAATFLALRTLCNTRDAFLTCLVMATIPLFALKGTIINADIPELFFVIVSFWLFVYATKTAKKYWVLFVSGVSAGLAFGAHEVSVALLVFYGFLFLAAYGIRRVQYWIMAGGFLSVLLFEAAYYWFAVGNPLYRFHLLLTQGAQVSDRGSTPIGAVASGGTLHLADVLDPILMLFTKHDFGALSYVAIPVLFWFFAKSRRYEEKTQIIWLMLGLALTWFLFCAIALSHLILLPRYYMVTVYFLAVVVALWFSRVKETSTGMQRVAMQTGLVGFVFINLACIHVDNKNPRFGERQLVEHLALTHGIVYTDPRTASDTKWFCRWAHVDYERVKSTIPPPGAIFFYNPKNADAPNEFMPASDVQHYQPRTAWSETERYTEPPRPLGRFVIAVGADKYLPSGIVRKLVQPNPTVYLYQVNDAVFDIK